MCTVAFIPKGDSYFFASLRDENPLRPKALPPEIYSTENGAVLSPADAMAGGTWIGVTETGNVIILLNGGFQKHERKNNYRKSRGLIVSALSKARLPVADWHLMDMNEIEPYTLVVWNEGNLYQLVWDGENKHAATLKPDKPYIWSSATLYDDGAMLKREALFHQWISTNSPVSMLSLFDFFKSYPDSENGFLINRNGQMKTLSYTFIKLKLNVAAAMQYYDLSTDITTCRKIGFNKTPSQSLLLKQAQ